MKKIIAFLILFTYLTFSISASADVFDDLFDYDSLVYDRGSFSSDITLSSDSTFEFLEVFDKQISPYSLKSIVQGITNSKMHIDADYSIKNDKIFKAHLKVTTYSPIKMNDGLKIDANAVFYIWINMNFVDSEKPYYKITLKTPMSEQYYVFCSDDENAILFYPAENRSELIKNTLQDGLRNNAKLIYNSEGYKLSVDDTTFKDTMEYLTKNGYKHLYLIANGSLNDTEKYEKFKTELPKMIRRLKYIQLLGKDGISQQLTFDENRKLSESELNLDIDTNIFKVHYSITGEQLPVDPTVEKPIINAANSDIQLNIGIKTTYSSEYRDFFFPRPNSSLITNVFEGDEYSLEYTTTEEPSSPYETIEVITPEFTQTINGTPYIPLRTMLNSLGVNNQCIFWLDGNIEVFEEVAPVLPFARITMSENSKTVICDGIPVTLSAPLIKINNSVYIPEDFVSKVLDATVLGYTTTYNHQDKKYYTTIEIERLKPAYYILMKNSSFTITE